jgi:hypothetical protein
MKLSLAQAEFFEREGFNGNVYIKKADNKGFNALLVNCITNHYRARLKNATRAYLVLEGKGSFVVNEKEYSAEPYDFFLISDGDIYEYHGQMKLFELNVPATDRKNEERL